MEHLYGSLFKTTEGAYGPLSSYGVIYISDIDMGFTERTQEMLEAGYWQYQPPHSLLLPRGLI